MFESFDEAPRTGASARARMGKKNPLHVLVTLIEADPSADNTRLWRQWWPLMLADEEYLEVVGRHAFHNMVQSLDRDRRKVKQARRQSRAEKKAAVELLKQQITRNVILMNITLPNGKKLRDATFAECSAAGGWFKSLAVKGKPSEIVGKTLTEQDLQKHRAGK